MFENKLEVLICFSNIPSKQFRMKTHLECYNISFFKVSSSYEKTSKLKSRLRIVDGRLHHKLLGERMIKFI